jgi:hypothetical protein
MSNRDKPLFQDSDEQEARFAPQQLPGAGPANTTTPGAAETSVDENLADPGLVPGAIAGGGDTGGTGPSTGTGTLSGVAPVAGSAGFNELIDEDEPRGEAK